MAKRELIESEERSRYFSPVSSVDESMISDTDEGTREIEQLAPFVISGGKNTERYYFKYVSEVTSYTFNVKPEYFGDESNYTEIFPAKITQILEKNADAKIFCVFDWDTIAGDKIKENKHKMFLNKVHTYIEQGSVVVCETSCFKNLKNSSTFHLFL